MIFSKDVHSVYDPLALTILYETSGICIPKKQRTVYLSQPLDTKGLRLIARSPVFLLWGNQIIRSPSGPQAAPQRLPRQR